MWNGLHTHTHMQTQTLVQLKHLIVLQCRQVVSHHLTSGEVAFLVGVEMLF